MQSTMDVLRERLCNLQSCGQVIANDMRARDCDTWRRRGCTRSRSKIEWDAQDVLRRSQWSVHDIGNVGKRNDMVMILDKPTRGRADPDVARGRERRKVGRGVGTTKSAQCGYASRDTRVGTGAD